ncbi:YfhO family protein [Streptomyces sp. NRRL S-87]|uniref:YfhO family protein n=1 Tax=Streptomyces sp. NRRL S-87 TaxID=1463920 RepID=UPI000B02E456|nr:YfhO family protein [Streptomyces sp. NRRL S-87]
MGITTSGARRAGSVPLDPALPTRPNDPRRRWSPPAAEPLYAPALAFVLTTAAFCTAWALRGQTPFGARPRAVNDQANQYVPFHKGLWDLVHGHGAGDLLFNWRGGFGQQYLADYATYLGNPFSWLTVLVPRRHVDIAVFALSPLTMGLAAALMAVYLGRLAPGSWWQRGVLGACYGLCGWALSDASYIPMWLWGLAALPLLGIAVEWCVEGRRWPAAALLVALAWAGNFYTGMMATIAATVLLAVRLLTLPLTGRERGRALVRAYTAAGTGILLVLPLLLPSYLASKASQPTGVGSFDPQPLDVFLTGMLPATHLWGGRPRLYVASLALVLALSFFFDRRTAGRTRLVWGAALVLVAASFQFPPTQFVWHGLAVPNGNPYREAFVFSALVVIVAWMALAGRPRPAQLAAGLGVLVGATFLLRRTDDFGSATWVAVLGGGALSLAALLLYLHGGRRLLPVAAVLMAAVVLAESALAATVADTRRARERWAQPAATAGASFDHRLAAVDRVDGWPRYRTDSGLPQNAYNDALGFRAEGPQYYSSYLSRATYRALEPLGYGFKNDGRTFFGADDPVLDAVFSIGARVRPAAGAPAAWTGSVFPAPPLVTVRTAPYASPHPAGVWSRREEVLGATVYEVPAGPAHLPAYTARCTPGTEAFWYSPGLTGTLTAAGASHPLAARRTGVLRLGTVPASGRVEISVRARGGTPAHPLACLDPTALGRAVRHLTATGATRVAVAGHSLTATLPPRTAGTAARTTRTAAPASAPATAVVATTAVPGWHCSGPATPFHGLLAVRLAPGTDRVSCSFTPPGLVPALAGAALGLLALTAVAAAPLLRRRRAARLP